MKTIMVSQGDFIDRHSILIIKDSNGLDVKQELLQYAEQVDDDPAYNYYLKIIISVNKQLWELEDRKRKEVERYSKEESDVSFLITQLNDLRHQVKKAADRYFNSAITEKKSH